MPTIIELLDAGVAQHRAGRLDQAEPIYKQILARAPDNADALHLLGLLVHQRGRHPEGLQLIQSAIQRNPRVPEYHHHLGLVLMALGRHEEAVGAFRHTLSIDANRPETLVSLGRSQLTLNRTEPAIESFKAALQLNPSHVDAISNLGVCYYEQERLDEAKDCFRQAIQINPRASATWNNLGAIRLEQGDTEGGAEAYDESIRLDPTYSHAYCNRLMGEQYRPSVTPEGLLALSLGWDERYAPHPAPQLPARPRGPNSPIRLGLVSPDFCRAPVGYFLIGLLKNLDRQEVTTIAYSDTPRFDDLSAEMKKHTSLWRDVRALADDRLVTAIRADGIDILIDFAGHTKGNRLNVFARRAAPVQASWAGYVGTTGLAAMDYLIADRFHVPEGWEKFYRENVVRLPDSYVCYEPPVYCPEVGPLPAERNGHLTFAGFHNVGKVGPLSIALWSLVLNALPDSRLVLKYKKLTDASVVARIRETFRSRGIPDERVAIEGTSPHLAMYQRYNECDIALDARPYSGGLTTLEALWMGVPVVTLPGRTFAGRHSLSHLSTVGLTECIAKDEDDFVRVVAGFARDLPRLAELRRGLRARMAQSPVCDHKRFADDFTALLKRIVKPAQPISRAAAR